MCATNTYNQIIFGVWIDHVINAGIKRTSDCQSYSVQVFFTVISLVWAPPTVSIKIMSVLVCYTYMRANVDSQSREHTYVVIT